MDPYALTDVSKHNIYVTICLFRVGARVKPDRPEQQQDAARSGLSQNLNPEPSSSDATVVTPGPFQSSDDGLRLSETTVGQPVALKDQELQRLLALI